MSGYLVLTIALGFRRDQAVVFNIRKIAQDKGKLKAFPDDYSPLKFTKDEPFFEWIPDFLQPFFLVIPIIQIIHFVHVFTVVSHWKNYLNSNSNTINSGDAACCCTYYNIWLLFTFLIILFLGVLVIYYRDKLAKKLMIYEKEFLDCIND